MSGHRDSLLYIQFRCSHSSSITLLYINHEKMSPRVRFFLLFFNPHRPLHRPFSLSHLDAPPSPTLASDSLPAARPSSLAAGRASAALLPRRWASSTPPRGRASCGPGERAPPPSPLGELAPPRGQASCGPGQHAPPPSPLSELRCLLARRRPSLSSSLAAGDPGGGELRRAP